MNAVLRISHAERASDADLEKLVSVAGSVALPADFWNEFHREVGNTGDLSENHKLLEQLT